jgi:hypothetical protein
MAANPEDDGFMITDGASTGAVAGLRRTPWLGFLLRAGLALLPVLGAGAYLAERFRIGYDDQDHQCLYPTAGS